MIDETVQVDKIDSYTFLIRTNWDAFDLQETMRFLANSVANLYSCNRPPGATGVLLKFPEHYPKYGILAGVGPPAHAPTCKDVGCEMENGHCVRTIHAEQRAICTAAKLGMKIEEGIMYSTLKPCYQCSKLIIAAGINRIFYQEAAYDEERTREILKYAGVSCIKVDHV